MRLKLCRHIQTRIVIDFEQNSQVLSQSPIAPVTFKIDLKNCKKALKFSYLIFDERNVLIDSADTDLTNSLLLFDTLLLKDQPKEFIIKNRLKNCEIIFKTTVFCELNAILVYENFRNEVRRRIEIKGKEQKIEASIVNRHDLQIMELNQSSNEHQIIKTDLEASIVNRHDLQIMELNQSSNEHPIIKTDLEKSQEDNRALSRSRPDFTKFNRGEKSNQNRVGDFFKEFTIKGLYISAISYFNCCSGKTTEGSGEYIKKIN